MRIETERLIIRNFERKDEQDLCEYMLQRVTEQYEGYPDFTEEKAKQEIDFRVKSDEFYAIELKENHKVIGNVYMGKRECNNRELGYVLHKEYQRRGYGSEAGKAVIFYFFQEGVHRIYAETAPGNIASWKLMEKLRMRREAHLRQNVYFHRDSKGVPLYLDTYIYAILASEESSMR